MNLGSFMRRLLSSNRNLVHKFVIKDPVVVEIFELKVRGKVNKMVIYILHCDYLFIILCQVKVKKHEKF